MQDITFNRIAFTGFAGAGKDTAAECLIKQEGYERKSFGDIIKTQLDPLVKRHFNFSAHTLDHIEKGQIRRTLEMWGEDNYKSIEAEFFRSLPERCVNTRLCRRPEAEQWKARGGIIIEVVRSNNPIQQGPSESKWLLEIEPLVDHIVFNNRGVEYLWDQVMSIAQGKVTGKVGNL